MKRHMVVYRRSRCHLDGRGTADSVRTYPGKDRLTSSPRSVVLSTNDSTHRQASHRLQKAFANIAGSNSFDGVFAGIIIWSTIKEFCADNSLPQRVYSTLYGLFHDMT